MRILPRSTTGVAFSCAFVALLVLNAWAYSLPPAKAAGTAVPRANPAAPTASNQERGASERATAIFAAGCFWCVQADFDKVRGVVSTRAGYAGGRVSNPTYEQVSAGGTGHAESVEVVYDPKQVTYEQLLDFYWRHVDPFTGDRQFCDVGDQYRPIIFYRDAGQKRRAEESKARIEAYFKRPVAVQIMQTPTFYPAEAYHQQYYRKNPAEYREYRFGCGRDRRLEQIWGKRPAPG